MLALLMPVLYGCIDSFELKSIGSADLLVVEGVFTDQNVSHEIRLSRTAEIDAGEFTPEENAIVTIIGSEGLNLQFFESSPGRYETGAVPFRGIIGSTYKLLIELADGSTYESDSVLMRATPAIESIVAEFTRASEDLTLEEDAIKIFARTGDPTGNTRFYRWEWEDTFEINTPLASDFEWVEGSTVIRREFPTDRCWSSDSSANILIKSTQNLEEDIVFRQLVRSIPAISEAWRVKYSILLRQFSLSESGFLFWEQLEKINEGQGTLFDQQPAAVVGNVRSITNPDEVVLGYFDAVQVREMRAFYTPEDFLSDGFRPSVRGLACEQDTISINRIGEFMQNRIDANQPYSVIDVEVDGFRVAPQVCSDCTSKGTNVRPTFWQD